MKKLQVFLSSAMNGELNTERELIRYLFENDQVISEFYELFAIEEHASPLNIKSAYCDKVESSELVIFIFHKQIRDAVLEEYHTARKHKKRTFIYLKDSKRRNKALSEFISQEIYKYNPVTFYDPQALNRQLRNDLLDDLLRIYTKEINLLSQKENVEYSLKSTLSPHSVYRFFKIDELLELVKDEEIKDLSVDQLISLSTLIIETKGNYRIGLMLIEFALIKAPNNWILYNNRGLILEIMGLSDAALFSYKKSAEINNVNETAYYNIGGVYFKLANYEMAIIYYKKSLEFNSEKKNAISQIAACNIMLKNPIDSLIWSKKAFTLQKDESSIINLISANTLNKNYPEALNLLELLKNSDYLYNNILSHILYEQGKFNESITIIEMLFEKGYLELDGAKRKFDALVSLQLEKESFEWFKTIESKYPITALDYNNFGYTYIEKLGKSEYSNYFFKKAIEFDKNLLPSWQNIQYNLAALGKFDLSKDICDETLNIFPFDKKTIQNKIRNLAEMGKFGEIIEFVLEKTFGLIGDDSNQEIIKNIVEQTIRNSGLDKQKFDELFKSYYELNKLLNKPSL